MAAQFEAFVELTSRERLGKIPLTGRMAQGAYVIFAHKGKTVGGRITSLIPTDPPRVTVELGEQTIA
jgi:hypothetical protein